MAKILVTGGPVHTYLDSVKIITNRFKGGRMAALAKELSYKGHEVTFICSDYGKLPSGGHGLKSILHRGFADYEHLVMKHVENSDMVILGAAVANLIPFPPWDVSQKFPSHNYEEGDEVNVPFRVAPRIINKVKKANPRTTLIGFKLLQGVERLELVRAAQLVAKESNASFVIANDASNLNSKLIVTRERSVIPALDITQSIGASELLLVDFLDQVARDEHYESWLVFAGLSDPSRPLDQSTITAVEKAVEVYERLIHEHKTVIEETGGGDGGIFGCIAVEVEGGGFVVSPRGKQAIDEPPVYVAKVNHETRHIVCYGGKASLNAPLLDNVLRAAPYRGGVKAVLHYHGLFDNYPELPYAPPGTVRDSQRNLNHFFFKNNSIFQIAHHGVFQVINEVRHV